MITEQYACAECTRVAEVMADGEEPGCSYPVVQPQEQGLWETEQKEMVGSIIIGVVFSFHVCASPFPVYVTVVTDD